MARGRLTVLLPVEQRPLLDLKSKLEGLIASTEERAAKEQVADLVSGEDEFAARLRADLGEELTATGVPALLRHWAGAVTARPTATWMRRARELTAAAPGAVELVRTVLTWLPAHRERVVQRRRTYILPRDGQEHVHEWTETLYLDQQTAVPLRGMVWSLEVVAAGWVVPLLGEVGVAAGTGIGWAGANARCELVANAAVAVLATRAAGSAHLPPWPNAALRGVPSRDQPWLLAACDDEPAPPGTPRGRLPARTHAAAERQRGAQQ
jgi:hypothetical protein